MMKRHPALSPVIIVRALLEVNRELLIVASGHSMHPRLKDKDIVKLVHADAEELRRGDVAAIAKGDDIIILHRVVRPKRKRTSLVTWGDNKPFPDPPCSDQQVLGRVVAIVSDNEEKRIDRRRFLVFKRSLLLKLIEMALPLKSLFSKTFMGNICKNALWSLLDGTGRR